MIKFLTAASPENAYHGRRGIISNERPAGLPIRETPYANIEIFPPYLHVKMQSNMNTKYRERRSRPLPVTQPSFTIVHRPCPRKAHNLALTVSVLAHLAQSREIRAALGRAIAEEPARPGIDSRLASLVSCLFEKGDESRAARSAQLFVAGAVIVRRPLRRCGDVDPLRRMLRRDGAGVRSRLARLDDDVAGHHLDVLVAQRAEHRQAGVVGDAEGAVGAVRFDVLADVGDVGDVLQETAMRAGHVGAHVLDEVVARRGSAAFRLAFGTVVALSLLARGTMFDAEDDVEELDEGALRVAASAVLFVFLLAASVLVYHAVRQSGIGHILASGKEWSDAVVEDVGVAILVHSCEERADLV